METSCAGDLTTIATSHAPALGVTVIPQRLRSLRKTRPRPSSPELLERPEKKRRSSERCSELNETDIAEMLLGLSNSPRSSSPRDSDVSTEDEELLPVTPHKRHTKVKEQPATKHEAALSAQLDAGRFEDLDEELGSTGSDSPVASKPVRAAKKLPGRCKCGKRVSAAHPPCKSELMLLCERFCERCGHLSAEGEPSRIHLNECAVALGVPRRRLYDITIVYEAVEVVKRTGKLAYVWRGLGHLPALVEQLRREEEAGLPVLDRKGSSPLQHLHAEKQATHSLWALSRKFIRLLLTTEGPIQLTDAAEHLIGDNSGAKRQQTQVTVERRLYDIGSILATLNLIHRTYVEGKRQPAFSWNWEWNRDQSPGPAPKFQDLVASKPPAQAPQPGQHGPAPHTTSAFSAPKLHVPVFSLAPPSSSRLDVSATRWGPSLPLGGVNLALPSVTTRAFPTLSRSQESAFAVSYGWTAAAVTSLAAGAALPPLAPLVLPNQTAGQSLCRSSLGATTCAAQQLFVGPAPQPQA